MDYRTTTKACYLAYIVQAAVNNLPTLLFVTFQREYGISMKALGSLIVLNFGFQLVVDLFSPFLTRHIGYRKTILLGLGAASLGFIAFALLPPLLGFPGLIPAFLLLAMGGGVVEVLISPVIEAIPESSVKNSAMTALHAFYCWGTVAVILITTFCLGIFPSYAWPVTALIWAIVPALTFALFLKAPIGKITGDGKNGYTTKELFGKPIFYFFIIMMVAAASSELAMSQWASYFVETGLGISKQAGDLLGPCSFAFFMGCVRHYQGKRKMISVERTIALSSLICMGGYALTVFSPYPMLSLVGLSIVGMSIALFWPGTFTLGNAYFPLGGTRLFALLAFFGDAGSALGPEVVSLCADIRTGLALAMVFPCVMGLASLLLLKMRPKHSSATPEMDTKGV